MIINLILCAGFIASGLLSVTVYRRSRAREPSDQLLHAALPVVVYVLGASFFGSLYRAPYLGWNAARLAPAIGWVRGHALYSTEQAGSVQTTMYPPFSAIAYAPAALFDEPTSAVVAGSLLAHLYYFLPVLYIALSAPGRRSLGFLLSGYALHSRLPHILWLAGPPAA